MIDDYERIDRTALAKTKTQAQHPRMDTDLSRLGRRKSALGRKSPLAGSSAASAETSTRHGLSPCQEVQLDRIEAALARLDAGDFGYCVECGASIDLETLTKDPSTAKCRLCSTAVESSDERSRQ